MKKWMLCLVALVGSATAQEPRPSPKSSKTKTFADPLFGISVTYPASMHFSRDPALIKAARRLAANQPEVTPEGRAAVLAKHIGVQFLIGKPREDAKVAFVANLNMTTGKVAPHPDVTNTGQYVKASRPAIKQVVPDAKSAYTPVEVKLGSRTWLRTLTFGTLGGRQMLFLQYIHFDPKTRMGYTLTITELASRDLVDVAALEQVAKTVRIKE